MIKIRLAGDVFPANLPYTIGFGIGNQFINNVLTNSELNLKLSKPDIFFANLESPIVKNDNLVNTSAFAGSGNFIDYIKSLGVNIVSLANNHILEQGEAGLNSTMEILKRNEIKFIGVKNESNNSIIQFNTKTLSICFAGFNGIHDIKDDDLISSLDKERILHSLEKMKEMNADIKIISLHWGNEYVNIPSFEQIELAHMLIDNGADIIVGHHPHVIQPVELYKNKLIIYSLGNTIFDFLFAKQFKRGMILDLLINENKEIKYEIIPIKLGKKSFFEIDNNKHRLIEIDSYQTKMTKYLSKGEAFYKAKYKSNLKYRKTVHRIYMKVHLLKLFITSDISIKSMIIKNVFNHLKKK